MTFVMNVAPHIAPTHEYADDARSYRAGAAASQAERRFAAGFVEWLINASGGPAELRFVQFKPTALECRTDALDYFAGKGARWAGFRQPSVQTRLKQLGITYEQVVSWAVAS